MMRIFSILGLSLIVALSALMIIPNAPFDPSRPTSAEVQFYRHKKDGKIPKRLRPYPNMYFYEQRAYPYATIPEGAVERAVSEAKAMKERDRSSGSFLTASTWAEAGPNNIPGRITSIAVHPSNLNTIYAAGAAGGVFKSTDGGNTWFPVFDSISTFPVGAIAINPQNANEIYVGTGEASASIDSYEGTGVYKSTDAGATWTFSGLPNSKRIGKIIIDPLRPDTVFCAVMGKIFGGTSSPDHGLYRTTDAGATWVQVLNPSSLAGCIDVNFNHLTGTVIAVIWRWTSGAETAIWRSTTSGSAGSFVNISGTGGLPASGTLGRIGVTVDPASNTWYASHLSSNSTFSSVYKSTNDGVTWTQTNDAALAGHTSNFGWYFGQIRTIPGLPNYVYVMGVTHWRSTDGGASWTNVTGITHVDHHELTIVPDGIGGHRLYNGCDGGVNLSSDYGNSWVQTVNMHNTQFYAITLDPADPAKLYGGTQDNGTNRTLTGNLNDWASIFGGDGFQVIVDYTNSNVIYCESQNGNIAKSTDGGFSFSNAQTGINGSETRAWNTPLVMHETNPQLLFTSTDRIYRSTNGALNWSVISPDLTTSYITAIGSAKTNPNVVYAGSRVGVVQVTTTGGGSWTDVGATLPDRWVTRLTVDPDSAGICYVTLSGYVAQGEVLPHIYRTTNFGNSWTNITSNLPQAPINDVIIDPHDNNTLYVGTDMGVYVSTNVGGSWAPLGTNLPITCVHDLVMHKGTRKLVAGTHGRSMYSTNVPCPDAADPDGDGIGNLCDNCPLVFNPDQSDIDADDIGDICDDCVDPDRDGFGNTGYPATTCALDNCPTTYNPDQADADFDGIGDSCEYIVSTVFDTISAGCTKQMVSNSGKMGSGGSSAVSMDFQSAGDCASYYLYEGTVAVSYVNGSDTVGATNMFSQNHYLVPLDGNPTVPVADSGTYEKFESGTFVTRDKQIAVEKTTWALKAADSCTIYIQCTEISSWLGTTINNVSVGEGFDWDVPSAGGNTGQEIQPLKTIYQIGSGTGCQNNGDRYGAVTHLGVGVNGGAVDTLSGPFSGRVDFNSTYLYPVSGFDQSELYDLMNTSGYSTGAAGGDLFSLMTFVNGATIGAGDTLRIYSMLISGRDGADSLDATIAKGRQWFNDHILNGSGGGCCIGSRGNVDCDGAQSVDIADLTVLVDHLFISFAPLCCAQEGDLVVDSSIDIADLTFLVDHLFISFISLPSCL